MPLRAIAVTRLLSGTPCAASAAAFAAPIARLRKNWSLLRVEEAHDAVQPVAVVAQRRREVGRDGAHEQRRRRRGCACVARRPSAGPGRSAAFRSRPAASAMAARRAGASSSRIQRSRSSTSGCVAPKRSTLPMPSLIVDVGAIARGAVLDDEDGHRGGDDAGHRADGAVGVAGREADRAIGQPAGGLGGVGGQALVDGAHGHGAALQRSTWLPRRSGGRRAARRSPTSPGRTSPAVSTSTSTGWLSSNRRTAMAFAASMRAAALGGPGRSRPAAGR